jgi:hypothetical protein
MVGPSSPWVMVDPDYGGRGLGCVWEETVPLLTYPLLCPWITRQGQRGHTSCTIPFLVYPVMGVRLTPASGLQS